MSTSAPDPQIHDPEPTAPRSRLVGLYNMRHGVWAAGSVRLSQTRSNGVIALWGVPPA